MGITLCLSVAVKRMFLTGLSAHRTDPVKLRPTGTRHDPQAGVPRACYRSAEGANAANGRVGQVANLPGQRQVSNLPHNPRYPNQNANESPTWKIGKNFSSCLAKSLTKIARSLISRIVTRKTWPVNRVTLRVRPILGRCDLAAKDGNSLAQTRRRPVRMSDIARKAGVSHSAVSLVLSGDEEKVKRVGPKKAEKIRRIARKLNFHPNHAARQLTGKRSGVVGAFGNWYDQTDLRVLSWLNELGGAGGLKILSGQSHAHYFDGVPGRFRQFVGDHRAHGLDGLIFVARVNEATWPEAAEVLAEVPRVISLLGNPQIPGASCVCCDAAKGVQIAVEHLHRQGRRKIVQILEDDRGQMNQQRQAAFFAAHQVLERPCGPDQISLATRDWWMPESFPKFLALAEDLVSPARGGRHPGRQRFHGRRALEGPGPHGTPRAG